jgi:hypothetical protein
MDKDEYTKAMQSEHNVEDYSYECDCNPYENLSDLIEEYALILETQNCPCCIRDTLLEFAVDIMQNFKMVKKED